MIIILCFYRLAAKSFPQKSPSSLQRACHSSSQDEETIFKNKNNRCLQHLRMVVRLQHLTPIEFVRRGRCPHLPLNTHLFRPSILGRAETIIPKSQKTKKAHLSMSFSFCTQGRDRTGTNCFIGV